MATITKSATCDPTAKNWSVGQITISLPESDPKLVTEDEFVIAAAKTSTDFDISEDAPAPAPVTPAAPAAAPPLPGAGK